MAESKLRELSMEFSVDIINLVKFLKANHEWEKLMYNAPHKLTLHHFGLKGGAFVL